MVKQTKAQKPENIGTGKVTPVQVAFIVDRYLSDNNFTRTRSIFRTEASSLISKTQIQEAPKSLLSLGAILDEYISLKEQKVMLDQEKLRVDTLLKGMQDVMTTYNSTANCSPALVSGISAKSKSPVSQSDLVLGSPAGCPFSRTSVRSSVPWLTNSMTEPTNFSTPATNLASQNKRKSSTLVSDARQPEKKPYKKLKKISPVEGSKITLQAHSSAIAQGTCQKLSSVSSIQGSSVAKCLFKQTALSIVTTSPGPKTPPQELTSETDKSVSPLENSSVITSNNSIPPEITPTITNSHGVSSETVIVSPSKHFAYYSVERNHYRCSPAKSNLSRQGMRDHVKGRLDFGTSDVPIDLETPAPAIAEIVTDGPSGEADFFDMDIPNLDIFGADFSLSEFLVDIDLECQPSTNPANELVSGSPYQLGDTCFEGCRTLSEFSSSFTGVLCEQDMNMQGPDTMSYVNSITKRVRILSPAKNRANSSLDQENLISNK
ncbi:hypothetical protein GIB67_007633 [Kingdonia uniflora]|uniref:LisH domain-containing protein n=1 Tax=Kingdonia uniflora TaxID=39325 RepID=A0A7J7N1V0_9MAGN|nr:hypothetical protein GIB67_007633 [Kingdonia uniflora]